MAHQEDDADLDALLDDCLNKMDEQERAHEEEVQERAATRATKEDETASGLGTDGASIINLLSTIMEGIEKDGDEPISNMEERLKAQIEQIGAMLNDIPDMTLEERQQYEQILQLVNTLKDSSLAASEGAGDTATPLPGEADGKMSEQELDAVRKVSELLSNLSVNDEEHLLAPSSDSVGEGGGPESPDIAAEALLKVLLDPTLVEPLRQMRESYPLWLAENESKTSAEDLARYKRQHEITISICDFLETNSGNTTDVGRIDTLVMLMHEYSSLAPLPPGLENFQPTTGGRGG